MQFSFNKTPINNNTYNQFQKNNTKNLNQKEEKNSSKSKLTVDKEIEKSALKLLNLFNVNSNYTNNLLAISSILQNEKTNLNLKISNPEWKELLLKILNNPERFKKIFKEKTHCNKELINKILTSMDFINTYLLPFILKNKDIFPKGIKIKQIMQVLDNNDINVFGNSYELERIIVENLKNNSMEKTIIKKKKNEIYISIPIKNPLGRIKWVITFSVPKNSFNKEKIKNITKLGEQAYLINILTDIITLQQVAELNYDNLTKALSRKYFESKFQNYIEQLNEIKDLNISYLLIDMDHFKKINDTYGHDIGDKILISLVNAIKKNIRSTDIVGRRGGEEFVVLLKHGKSKISNNELLNLIKRILKDFNKESKHYVNNTVTLSIGGVLNINSKLGEQILNPEKIFKESDKLLYNSKNERNKINIINEGKIFSSKIV